MVYTDKKMMGVFSSICGNIGVSNSFHILLSIRGSFGILPIRATPHNDKEGYALHLYALSLRNDRVA